MVNEVMIFEILLPGNSAGLGDGAIYFISIAWNLWADRKDDLGFFFHIVSVLV